LYANFPLASRWAYVETGLSLLEKLRNHLDVLSASVPSLDNVQEGVPSLSPDTLSVSQQQNVAALLQLVGKINVIRGKSVTKHN